MTHLRPRRQQSADAKARVHAAVAEAGRDARPVRLVFAADGCGDREMRDQSFKEGRTAGLIAANLRIVKIDATQAGEVADARKLGDAGTHDFFARTLPGLR